MTEAFDLEVEELHDKSAEELVKSIKALDEKGKDYQYLMVILMGHGGETKHIPTIKVFIRKML